MGFLYAQHLAPAERPDRPTTLYQRSAMLIRRPLQRIECVSATWTLGCASLKITSQENRNYLLTTDDF
jgi:hypothetical protein